MTDIIKKLNVLIRASINDLASLDRDTASDAPSIGKRFDRDLKELHKRIEDAYAYEDELKARIASLESDVSRLQDEADEKIADRQVDAARRLTEQGQRAKQRLSMAQADLREHMQLTQELVLRVSELEQAVEQVRQNKASAASGSAESRSTSTLDDLSAALRSARDSITGGPAKGDSPAPPPKADSQPPADDLESRRQRLSKR